MTSLPFSMNIINSTYPPQTGCHVIKCLQVYLFIRPYFILLEAHLLKHLLIHYITSASTIDQYLRCVKTVNRAVVTRGNISFEVSHDFISIPQPEQWSIQGLSRGVSIFLIDGHQFHNLPFHCPLGRNVLPRYTLSDGRNMLTLPITHSFTSPNIPFSVGHDIHIFRGGLFLWRLLSISIASFNILG